MCACTPASGPQHDLFVFLYFAQISVDTFLIGNAYLDVATVGCISRYTAGHVYHYTQFTRAADAERLTADIVHDLTRETGFEAVMRIR